MSVVGLYQWRKAGKKVEDGEIHLGELTPGVSGLSAGMLVLVSSALIPVLKSTGDPAPVLDAIAVSMSIIGTWWLAMSYIQQWFVWIAADVITTTLCIVTGQYALAALYLAYIVSAFYGYFHWKRRGKVVS